LWAQVGLEQVDRQRAREQALVDAEEHVGDRPFAREDGSVQGGAGIAAGDEAHLDPGLGREGLDHLAADREGVVRQHGDASRQGRAGEQLGGQKQGRQEEAGERGGSGRASPCGGGRYGRVDAAWSFAVHAELARRACSSGHWSRLSVTGRLWCGLLEGRAARSSSRFLRPHDRDQVRGCALSRVIGAAWPLRSWHPW